MTTAPHPVSQVPEVPPIQRHGVLITPTIHADIAALDAAFDNPDLFRYFPAGITSLRPAAGSAKAGIDNPARLPLTVRRMPDNTVVGSTSLYEHDPELRHIAIGYTWYSRALHRTGINPRTKLALLEWLFDSWNAKRVTLYVDNLNIASQRAVTAIGATHEGTLRRNRRRADGTLRDTLVYSILDTEWPTVHEGLSGRVHQTDKSGLGAVALCDKDCRRST